MSVRRSVWVSVVVVLVLCAGAARASAASPDLPYPPSLRPQVEFWKKIFGVYSTHQILLHDTENLGRVYAVLDFRDRAAAGEDAVTLELVEKDATASEKARIRDVLLRLAAREGNAGGLDVEEQKIWKLFGKDKGPATFSAAADPARIRAQRGLKERFGAGVRRSRRYLPEMEEVFRSEGLPVELTRLPLVESCFDIDAYSKVGAAGIWQFMPSTGRSYMRIDGLVDERRDPLRATRGAARHLAENHQALGTWPLAITAYNHGRAGMQRAVRETGTTDIGRIVHEYRGPLFGFASRNFYAEFLAALEIERSYRDYFGELNFEPPFTGDEVRLERALAGKMAASCAEVPPEDLAALNPAVDSAVFHGRGSLPRGYLLRVPQGTAGAFQQRLAQIAADAEMVASATAAGERSSSRPGRGTVQRTARARGGAVQRTARGGRAASVHRTHRVASGQTLSHIASRYGVSLNRLKRANSLRGSTVKAGQVLRIPAG